MHDNQHTYLWHSTFEARNMILSICQDAWKSLDVCTIFAAYSEAEFDRANEMKVAIRQLTASQGSARLQWSCHAG